MLIMEILIIIKIENILEIQTNFINNKVYIN